MIDERLNSYDIEPREDAHELVRRARALSMLADDQAIAVADEQVRAVRDEGSSADAAMRSRVVSPRSFVQDE